jgi:fructosamine-3-kinase
MIPEHIKSKIEVHFNEKIINFKSQSGGDINDAAIITVESEVSYFLKWNTNASPSMFHTEAKGLKLLSDAKTSILIPLVILSGKDFLLLSVIEAGTKSANSDLEFGMELAKLHQCSASEFGLEYDNFIGKLPQSNSSHKEWSDFFITERIEPQIKTGVDSGKFSTDLIQKTYKLHSIIQSNFPNEKPALLHGDLWSGNYMYSKGGAISIYDPAVYFGHREMDISMTRLFGGFSAEFYEGYNSAFPLAEGFEQRISLCNLYPILVHANIFGGGYVRRASDILRNLVKDMA